MTLTGLAPVLIVPDVGEALAFYRDKLGFEVDDWEPKPAAYGYAQRDDCHLHFCQGEQPPWQMLEIRVQDPFGYILAFGQPLT